MGRPIRALIAILAGLLLLPLVVAKTDESRVTFEEVGKIVATGDLYFEDAAASDFRYSIDQNGNGDGQATASEVNNFEIDFKDFIEDDVESSFINTVNVDGKSASTWTLDLLDILDAPGPVDDDSTITMKVKMTLNFAVTASQSHTYFVDMETDPEADANSFTTETITAPPGYTIETATGFPGNLHIADDKKSLTYTESETYDTDQRVVFSRAAVQTPSSNPAADESDGESRDGPGLSFVAAVSLLLAVVWVVRRSR